MPPPNEHLVRTPLMEALYELTRIRNGYVDAFDEIAEAMVAAVLAPQDEQLALIIKACDKEYDVTSNCEATTMLALALGYTESQLSEEDEAPTSGVQEADDG